MFEIENFLVRIAQWGYRPILYGVVKLRWAVVPIAIAGFAASLLLLREPDENHKDRLGRDFIPKLDEGDIVVIANRDPATFENPDEYVPTRPNARQHLAFAAGPHVCIGMHLARLEAHTAITRLLQRLPDIALEPHTPSPRGLVFRKPEAVNAVWSRASLPPG